MTPAKFAPNLFKSTSRSPGTKTEIGAPSAISKTFFNVSAAEIFAEYFVLKTSTNESIVGVFGVSKISIAGDFSPLNGETLVTIASTFAA